MSDIVKNARTALLLMNERGLAPTPDNYARTYNEVSGADEDNEGDSEALNARETVEHNRRLMRYLDELATSISANTGDLAETLDRQGGAIRQFMAELQQTGDKLKVAPLLQPIITLINSVQQSVKNSHQELVSTREALQGVSSELFQTKQQMLIDPLTGARNRLNMEHVISQERSRAKRNKTALVVAMVDLDHFKKLNDSFGHEVGDKVLSHFAEIARTVMRDIDTLFRYGGEEFLMLFPETNRKEAELILQRFREAMVKNLPVNRHDKSRLPITFSAGVAELTEDDDAQSLISRADKALYLAKQRGRDCTVTDLQFGDAIPAAPEVKAKIKESDPAPKAPSNAPTPEVLAKPAAKPKAEAPKTRNDSKLPLEVEKTYLGRVPILHTDHELFGYDLFLYASRLGREQPPVQFSDLLNCLDTVGIEHATHEHMGFVPVNRENLMGSDIKRLPAVQMTLEITDISELDQKTLERCQELKDRGFKLSLGDYFDQPAYDAVLKIFDYVKMDIHATSNFEMRNAITRLRDFGYIQRIAKNVDTLGTLERCVEMEFHLLQGNFGTHSEASTLGDANPEQTTLLVVLGQLLTDVDLPRIERAFQNHDELTDNLLALVNSAAMGLSRKVGSLQQALVILGRRQLMRWVQVLLYSHSDIKSAPMLMQMATARAKLMDLLCSTHGEAEKRSEIYRDRAFTVGILSLTHILLGMDLLQVVEQIGLDDDVRLALLEREGFLGNLLSLTEHVESAKFEEAEALLDGLSISPRDLNRAQMETLKWVHNLGKAAD